MRTTTLLFLSGALLVGGRARAEPSDPASPEPEAPAEPARERAPADTPPAPSAAPGPEPDAHRIGADAWTAHFRRQEEENRWVLLVPIFAGVAYRDVSGIGMTGFDGSIGIGGEGPSLGIYFRAHYFQGITAAGRAVYEVNPGVMFDWHKSRIHFGLGAQAGIFIAENVTTRRVSWAQTLGLGASVAVDLYSWGKSWGKPTDRVSTVVLETSGSFDLLDHYSPLWSVAGGLGVRL